MGYGTADVVQTASLIIGGNPTRISTIITNQGPSTVFIGPDSLLSTATAISIASGSNLTEDSGGDKLYQGPYYAISVSFSNLRYWERTR